MPEVRWSFEAEEDLEEIVSYSTTVWGWRQTDQYLAKIEDGLALISQNPLIGRSSESVRQGLRRFEIGKHVVFYLVEPGGILVIRLLHQRMLPVKYL